VHPTCRCRRPVCQAFESFLRDVDRVLGAFDAAAAAAAAAAPPPSPHTTPAPPAALVAPAPPAAAVPVSAASAGGGGGGGGSGGDLGLGATSSVFAVKYLTQGGLFRLQLRDPR
jgi:hypothetical protein